MTASTKLEDMFEIIEATGFDIIAGQMGMPPIDDYSPTHYESFFDIERNKNGFCYNRSE